MIRKLIARLAGLFPPRESHYRWPGPVPRPPDFSFVPEPPRPAPCPNCGGRPQIQIARDAQGWVSLVVPGVGVFPLPPSVVAACAIPAPPAAERPKLYDPEPPHGRR